MRCSFLSLDSDPTIMPSCGIFIYFMSLSIKHTAPAMLCVCVCVQLCLILCDPMDCIPSDSSVHVIFQARILNSVAISSSSRSSNPGIKPMSLVVSCIGQRILYHCTTWEALLCAMHALCSYKS